MSAMVLLLVLQAEPVSGQITSISADGKLIRANLGRSSRLKVRDGLRIFSSPEIVTLPGTKKAAFAKEREIGGAIIVEVLDKELVAQVVGATEPLLKGSRVVPGKAVKRGPLPPHIREGVSLKPAEAAWGSEVSVSLDIEDLDGDLASVECRVDGGLLVNPVSNSPRLRWLPPAQAGDVKLTVRAIDRNGLEDERTLTLKASGVAALAKPSAFLLEAVFGTPFLRADDLGSDPEGNLFILDKLLRRIIKWAPSGRQEWVSGRYGPEMGFTRLVIAGPEALLVDRIGRRVLRYALEPGMFEKGPKVTYGGGRREPGSLRRPVDLAVLPEGDVWVLDGLDRTIRTYAAEGLYQTAVGSFQAPSMLRLGPDGAVHVLDAGRRQILTFERFRLVRKTPLPGREMPVDFLDPSQLLYADRWDTRMYSGARVLRRDVFGRTYVIESGGQFIVRLGRKGKPLGFRESMGGFKPTLVRALPSGGFYLEDDKTRWSFDEGGWNVRTSPANGGTQTQRDAAGTPYALSGRLSCGGVPLDLGDFRPADFDVDPFGRVLVLERGTARVLRLSVRRRQD